MTGGPPEAYDPLELPFLELSMWAKDAARRAAEFAATELGFLDGPETRDPAALAAAMRELVKRLARAELLELAVPPESGGYGRLVEVCILRERLARAHGLADLAFAMQGLGSAPIGFAGSAEQRARWLPRIASGEAIAAFAITEEGAGSDVGAMTAAAARDGDGYRITGEKTFISNAGVADVYVLFARTDPGAGRRGISAFLVTPDLPGFRVVRALDVIAPHPIGTIALDGVRVPAAARLGDEGAGFGLAMKTLGYFRPSVGAAACGFAARALDEALARARSRAQFGAKIGTFQQVQAYLAEMATELAAARLLVFQAAMRPGAEGAAVRSSMAKLFATEAAQRIVDRAVQIHGGAGVLVGSVVERLYREVRALRIYEGTSEIQRLVIARELLGKL